jgi:hypothetical protein
LNGCRNDTFTNGFKLWNCLLIHIYILQTRHMSVRPSLRPTRFLPSGAS